MTPTPLLFQELCQVLAMIVKFIKKYSDEKRTSFNPRPYFKIFIKWILDLCSLDPVDGANFQVLTALANVFHALQPLKFPGFSFAWLELISRQKFHAKITHSKCTEGVALFSTIVGRHVSVHGAIFEECRTWREGVPLYCK